MKIIAVSKKGKNKSENEDRIIVGKSIIAEGTFLTQIKEGVVAVADGVGGNSAGSVASHFIANKLCGCNNISDELFKTINDELLQLSKENAVYHDMATTLSGILLSRDKNHMFSIGNTRVYLLKNGKYLKQLTNDDTTLNYLLSTGQLTLVNANEFDRKNEITACFGGGTSKFFKIKIVDIEMLNAPVLITSDGVHDYITIDEMENIIEKFGISAVACEVMITAAENNGSRDDISIVLGDM